MLRDVMTPEQVADYLQLDKETVYRLIRDRKLAATRIGRAYRIPREDLDTFLMANSTRPEVRKTWPATVVSRRVFSNTASGWKTARKRRATRS